MPRLFGVPFLVLFVPSIAVASLLWLMVGNVVRDSGRDFRWNNIYFFDNLDSFDRAIAEQSHPGRRRQLRILQISSYVVWAWCILLFWLSLLAAG